LHSISFEMKVENFPVIIFFIIMIIFSLTMFLPKKHHGEYLPIVGQNIQLNELESATTGKVFEPDDTFILHVFASWCGACKRDLSILKKINGKVKIYGLIWKDGQENAIEYHKRKGIYDDILKDKNMHIVLALGIRAMPETFIIGKDGTVYYSYKGPINDVVIKDDILPKFDEIRRIQSK